MSSNDSKQWKKWHNKLMQSTKNMKKAKSYKTKHKYSKQQTEAFWKLSYYGKKLENKRGKK